MKQKNTPGKMLLYVKMYLNYVKNSNLMNFAEQEGRGKGNFLLNS